MIHVPYRGEGPALTDPISGQVQLMFVNTVSSIEFIRAGRLRAARGYHSATRSAALQDVPTIGEFVAGFEAYGWGVWVRRRTRQRSSRS